MAKLGESKKEQRKRIQNSQRLHPNLELGPGSSRPDHGGPKYGSTIS